MANTTTRMADYAVSSLGAAPWQPFLKLPFEASWKSIIVVGSISYVGLCSLLRFRRIKNVRARYNFHDRASLARMTNQEAHEIIKTLVYYEFPLFYDLSLRVALFKTYAMRNVAKLLSSVSDLSKDSDAGKRYEDTAVLYSCFANFAPTSEFFHKAVARTNYLHAPYIKSGRMLNEDLLYVLYASMVEPVRFMSRYEWRPLQDVELAAIGMFWKYIGEGMQIDFKAELGRDDWKDGIEFFEDVEKWSLKYEDANMGPFEGVYQLGQVSMNLLMTAYPAFARPLAYRMVLVLQGERLRHAFGMPEPGIAESAFTYTALLLRQKFIRYLCLPRLSAKPYLSDPDPKTGRIYHYQYLKEPWYNPATLRSRWNPEALLTWATGGMLPGDEEKLKPQGFLFEDLGPRRRMGKGVDEAPDMEDVVRKSVSGGCPFAIPK